jgi:hypothetical protein
MKAIVNHEMTEIAVITLLLAAGMMLFAGII